MTFRNFGAKSQDFLYDMLCLNSVLTMHFFFFQLWTRDTIPPAIANTILLIEFDGRLTFRHGRNHPDRFGTFLHFIGRTATREQAAYAATYLLQGENGYVLLSFWMWQCKLLPFSYQGLPMPFCYRFSKKMLANSTNSAKSVSGGEWFAFILIHTQIWRKAIFLAFSLRCCLEDS